MPYCGHFLGLGQIAADERDDFHAVDVLDAVQVLDAEGAGAGQCDFDGLGAHSVQFSRIRWPTAVFGRRDGRSGAPRGWRPPGHIAMAPRAISHITSSMPSLPASRT